MPRRTFLSSNLVRVSRPGFDVLNEPLGSPGIAFDSRLDDFGIIHAQGIMGVGVIGFPALPYVPLASINRIDGSSAIITEDVQQRQFGTSDLHWYTPYVGVVTPSSLQIMPLPVPYYTLSLPGGIFMYTIWAIAP